MDLTTEQSSKKMSAKNKTELPNEFIEEKAKKVPNLLFLTLALGSMAGSLVLALNKQKEVANFIGQWVPTLLIFGLYNKIVKVEDEILALH